MRARVPSGARPSRRHDADRQGGATGPFSVTAGAGLGAGPPDGPDAGRSSVEGAAPAASPEPVITPAAEADPIVSDTDVDTEVTRRTEATLRGTVRAGVGESAIVMIVLVLYALLPGRPPLAATAFATILIVVATCTLAAAFTIRRSAVGSRAILVLSTAWVAIDAAAICAGVAETGAARSDLYLLFLVVTVFQGGVRFPRALRLGFNAIAAIGYLVTMAVVGWNIGTATVVLRIGMIGALAWGVDMLSMNLAGELRQHVRITLDSQRRARLWQRVAALRGTLAVLDEASIWDWVVDAVADLGYTAAAVCVFDTERRSYTIAQATGLPEEFTGSRQPLSVGIAGSVLDAGRTIITDYATFDRASPPVRAAGVRTTVGVPIRVHGKTAAALVVGSLVVRRPGAEELAALDLVAAHAGHGLAAARAVSGVRRDADSIRTILASAPDAMLVYDGAGIVHQANREAARLFGYSVDELVGMDVAELGDPTAADPGLRQWDRPPAGRKIAPPQAEPTHGLRKDGSSFPAEIVLAPVDTAESHFVAATVRDVSERLEFEHRLAHHASHDDLTGLPNRTLFLERLGTALAGAAAQGSPVTVFFLDVDHFKYVNDSRGHDVGDELVTDVARRLHDTAGGELVARFGGDEFAVLRTDIVDSQDALARAWHLLGAFDRPFVLDGVECHLSASVGVAFGTRTDSAPDVMRRADAAMYHAKQRGRARVELFDEVLTARAAWRLDIASALHDAIDNNELHLVYQPVVDLADSRIIGVEALLRWQRPSGSVSPATFVPVAEDSGLIVPIGRWVLQQSCQQVASWLADGIDPSVVRMSVNVSSRQIDHDRFIGDVAAAIDDTGIPPETLVLEITESSFIDDLPAAARRIEALHQLGVSIAIDDFGTGFSSLSSLSLLPIDAVKIDKTFVDGLGTRYDTVIRAVVDVADTFGLLVVAEGVERAYQAEELRALGCRYAQGFLYARPLREADARATLKRGVLEPGGS